MLRNLLLMSVLLVCSVSASASDDDFLLNYIPALVASLSCEEGQFEACPYPGGCRRINGLWNDGMCMAKSEARLNTELMFGQWSAVSSFSNGDFFNYLEFKTNSLKPIPGSGDFYLAGYSFDTSALNPAQSNEAILSYDSNKQDWFILDYWGRDIGTISSIEINRVNNNLFTGCEFYLNFPDLTYQDGVCNPVRMTRGVAQKISSVNILSNRTLARVNKQFSNSSAAPTRVAGAKFRPHLSQFAQTGGNNE